MNYTDHDVPLAYCIVPGTPRPIVGLVLHDTETAHVVECYAQGSWHWQIDRDGSLHRHVEEANIGFHVRDCDRFRPDWVRQSPYYVSDVNYCTIGIELVSWQGYRDAGVPFTDAQYVTLTALLTDLTGRYGPLPMVGHGQLQLDRSDPVQFDWTRLPATAPPPPPPPGEQLTPEQRAILDLMAALNANAGSIQTWISRLGRGAEIGRQLLATPRMLQKVRPLLAELTHLAD